MKQNKYILLFISVLLLSSCATRKIQHITDTKLIVKDSISIIETTQYDTVTIPGDTLIQTFTIECDSLTNKPKPYQVRQKTGRLSQTIAIDSKGILTAQCHTDSLLNIIAKKNREIAIYKAIAYTKSDDKTIVIEHCTKHKWRWYSLFLNIALVGWLLRKPFAKLIGLAIKFI